MSPADSKRVQLKRPTRSKRTLVKSPNDSKRALVTRADGGNAAGRRLARHDAERSVRGAARGAGPDGEQRRGTGARLRRRQRHRWV